MAIKNKILKLGILSVLSAGITTSSLATGMTLANTGSEKLYDAFGLPILFSSEDWGVGYGAALAVKGFVQPQANLFGLVTASSNGSMLGYLGVFDMMIPSLPQLQIDASILESKLDRNTYYLPGNPNYVGQLAGSNDSSANNSIISSAREQIYQVNFKYTLPIGYGRDGAIAAQQVRAQRADQTDYDWNPLKNGITRLDIEPFYQVQRLTNGLPAPEADSSMGVELSLIYDNRNSTQLPSAGSYTKFTWTYDWGSNDRPSWSTVDLEYSKFFDLGSNDWMKQQVLAFRGWIADTPTWNDETYVNGVLAHERTPSFVGVALGGMDKLRGYDTNRFAGRSALLYTLEYRVLPQWQPLNDIPYLNSWYYFPWWQWTLFVDAGRVADNFNIGTLHENMKVSIGGGIRFNVEGLTVRTELVGSDEDSIFRIYANQPF